MACRLYFAAFIVTAKRVAGKIFTVNGREAPEASEKETLLAWCKTVQYKGVRGYIVDGGCRDSGFIESVGFPVWCRCYTPVDIVSRWVPEEFNAPIEIGGVTIHADDYVFADRDGIAIIPKDIAGEVADRAEKMINTENLVRKAILEGVDPVDAYLKFGKF